MHVISFHIELACIVFVGHLGSAELQRETIMHTPAWFECNVLKWFLWHKSNLFTALVFVCSLCTVLITLHCFRSPKYVHEGISCQLFCGNLSCMIVSINFNANKKYCICLIEEKSWGKYFATVHCTSSCTFLHCWCRHPKYPKYQSTLVDMR